MNGAPLAYAVDNLFAMRRLAVATLLHLEAAGVAGGDLVDFILPDWIEDIGGVAGRLQQEVDGMAHAEVERRRAGL